MHRIAIEPSRAAGHEPGRYTFSPALEVNGTIWFSGQSAARKDAVTGRSIVSGDIVEQANVIYAKLNAIAAAGRIPILDLVRTVDYVTPEGTGGYSQLNELRTSLFGDRCPMATPIAVDGLMRSGAVLEIEAIAQRGLMETGANDARLSCAGDLLFLSTEGDVALESQDVEARARAYYKSARDILDRNGVGVDRIAKVTEFLTCDALDRYEAIRQVRETFLREPVVVTTVTMARMFSPTASIHLDFVAAAPGRELVRCRGASKDPNSAAAVRVGRTVIASGTGASGSNDDDTLKRESQVVMQARTAYKDLETNLARAGSGLEDVVQTVEFVDRRGLASYRETASVRRQILTPPYPAATGIVCTGFLDSNQFVRVDGIAMHGARL